MPTADTQGIIDEMLDAMCLSEQPYAAVVPGSEDRKEDFPEVLNPSSAGGGDDILNPALADDDLNSRPDSAAPQDAGVPFSHVVDEADEGAFFRRLNGLRHPLRTFRRAARSLRDAWQRARRGYSDTDVWSMNLHLLEILPAMLEQLAEQHCGHPADMADDEWTAFLRRQASLLRQASEDTGNPYLEQLIEIAGEGKDDEHAEIVRKWFFDWEVRRSEERQRLVSEALSNLAERFYDLWD